MQDRDVSKSNAADVLGFVGLAFAVFGVADFPLLYRLFCLFGASFCLPLSFHRQCEWPPWVRWVLSLTTIAFLCYAGSSLIRAR
jgi:hypothetical protein